MIQLVELDNERYRYCDAGAVETYLHQVSVNACWINLFLKLHYAVKIRIKNEYKVNIRYSYLYTYSETRIF